MYKRFLGVSVVPTTGFDVSTPGLLQASKAQAALMQKSPVVSDTTTIPISSTGTIVASVVSALAVTIIVVVVVVVVVLRRNKQIVKDTDLGKALPLNDA